MGQWRTFVLYYSWDIKKNFKKLLTNKVKCAIIKTERKGKGSNKMTTTTMNLNEIKKEYERLHTICQQEGLFADDFERMEELGQIIYKAEKEEQKRIKREELKAELLANGVNVEELKQELETVEDRIFNLQMVDYFTTEQRELDRMLRNQRDTLNKQIEALTM